MLHVYFWLAFVLLILAGTLGLELKATRRLQKGES